MLLLAVRYSNRLLTRSTRLRTGTLSHKDALYLATEVPGRADRVLKALTSTVTHYLMHLG